MIKTTLQYLKDNNLNISTGLAFTCNDYYFLVDNKFDTIVINFNKTSSEKLSKKDIINRIYELYVLYKKDSDINDIKEDDVIKILKDNKPEIFRIEKIKKLLNNNV